ncbi:MAG: nucleotidyl transferase AbiEii/AbiGii toxin family protein [Bacteroidales bacterium]|nr:nucleotidyl transferase AbiEii/AbiGii toxin family protein [Candidatus Scybalousia scybalohippi]MCQ2327072.1 nucleotidyl transferase AbiEii/AbiGii toxin family protein [Bacteroidales bacterium]
MNKLWINNELVDRLAMLQQTEIIHPGINQVAIEKDWWVTLTLKALFQTECAESLLFKGGTSLSKGFNIIERFSEDIDLAINHSFFGIEKTTNSQREKLRKLSRAYIHETLSTQLDENLKKLGALGYRLENVTHVLGNDRELHPIDSDKDPTVILLHYPSIVEETISYIHPRVKIEISSLSMDEPSEERDIRSLIGETFEGEDIGVDCKVRTVVPTRTFLEKLFLLAEEFQRDKPRSVRMSRHLYDIEKLMNTKYGKEALSNRQLYDSIVEHRRTYYALKYVNYDLHDPSTINFMVPKEERDAWAKDYADMRRFFIYGDSLDFNTLMKRIDDLQGVIRNGVIDNDRYIL